jgi:hypothetical protein
MNQIHCGKQRVKESMAEFNGLHATTNRCQPGLNTLQHSACRRISSAKYREFARPLRGREKFSRILRENHASSDITVSKL